MDKRITFSNGKFFCMNDLAWAAGFVDGEGCIRIHKQVPKCGVNPNPIYSLEVTISQNRLETLQHLKDKLDTDSSIYVCPTKGKVRRAVFALTYRCTRARVILKILSPYLVRKKEEAALGIEFSDHISIARMGRRRHSPAEMALREEYFQRMKALK